MAALEVSTPGHSAGSASGRVAVLGAGGWGTALALQALRAGATTTLWTRRAEHAGQMRAEASNSHYLPGISLPAALTITADATEALQGADLALLAVPCQHIRAVLGAVLAQVPHLPPLLLCAKGIEAGTLRLPLEVVEALAPGLPTGILAGPNFAAEIAAGQPAAAVLASLDPGLRRQGMALLTSPSFRLYAGADPVGVELGGATKNVIAIGAGAVIGAGLGENARAALITRSLAEVSRLVVTLGGQRETVFGLSGLGDLLLTATGGGSRNFSAGLALGRGEALADILAHRAGVTEGVATAPALVARAAEAGVEMPVCAAVAALLEGRLTVEAAASALLNRPPRGE